MVCTIDISTSQAFPEKEGKLVQKFNALNTTRSQVVLKKVVEHVI